MATDLCFPVLKFSHATGVRSDHTIPWTHLSASDVFVVVKGANTHVPDGHLALRIVQGNQELESIDIASYVDRAIETRRGSEQAGLTPQVEQLPIFGITKESLLALRYRLRDDQARRLQLRMQNPTECRQLVGILERRGMEFQEQRPRTARPGTRMPSTNTSQNRLLAAQTNSPYFEPHSPTRRDPFATPPIEAGSFSQPRSVSHERSHIRSDSPNEKHESASQEMLPPKLFTRDVEAAPTKILPTRPSTAQMYRSYTTPSQPEQYDAREIVPQPYNPSAERSSSLSVATSGTIYQAVKEYENPHRSTFSMPTQNQPPMEPSLSCSSGNFDVSKGRLHPSDPTEPRAVTARPCVSARTPLPDTLEHEIPPRRELPFGRPESRYSGSEKSSSRPGTSSLTLPPLSKPNIAKEGSTSPSRPSPASPAKDDSLSRPGTASPLKRSFVAYQDEVTRPQKSLEVGNNVSPKQAPTKAVSPGSQTISPNVPSKRPSRMDELLYGRKVLADRSANTIVPRLDSLMDAPHELESPPGTAASPPRVKQLPSPTRTAAVDSDPTLGAYTAIRSSLRHPQEVSVDVYAAQSLEDRQATLDEFMVEHLESSAFTTLCEDVENCWRRIALGL